MDPDLELPPDVDLELPPDVDGPMGPDLELPPDDDGPELPCNDDEGLSLEDIIGNRPAKKYRRAKQSATGSEPATSVRPSRKNSGGCAPAANQFSEFANVLFDGKTVSPHSLSSLPVVPTHSSLKLLELFAGTGSVGKVFQQAGHDVVSLDITDKGGIKPTVEIDIMEWDYKQYPPGTFQVLWGSPPCEHYSVARTTAKTPRDFPYYDALVEKTLEIIDWQNPTYWFLENPQTGLLKSRPFMADLPWVDVDYCMYGAFYRKRTRLWGRLPPRWQPRKLCNFNCHACGSQRKHPSVAQRSDGWHVNQLHRIPPLLVRELVMSIS